jgi:hypothetical protein
LVFFTGGLFLSAPRAPRPRDLSSLDWYVALGSYKLAIIAEGIHARFLMGMTVGAGFESVGAMVPAIVEGALEVMANVTPAQ